MSIEGMLMAVAVVTEGDEFEIGASTPLFQTGWEPGRSYDVAPGGQRFIINEMATREDMPISIIVNWQAGSGRETEKGLR